MTIEEISKEIPFQLDLEEFFNGSYNNED